MSLILTDIKFTFRILNLLFLLLVFNHINFCLDFYSIFYFTLSFLFIFFHENLFIHIEKEERKKMFNINKKNERNTKKKYL